MRRLALLFVSLVFVCAVTAQEVRFYATVDAEKILLGSTVSVTFTIENSSGGNFSPPDFSYAKQIGGVSQSSRTSIVNGRASSSKAYTYTLLPNMPGPFKIPPAQYRVGKNMYQTRPLTVQVIEADQRTSKDVTGQDVIIRLEVSDSSLYIGQQAVLEYVLYHRVSVNNYQIENESDYSGFFVQEAKYRSSSSKREIINGREYYRNVLKRLYLFPQRRGTYTFGPVEVTIGISNGQRRFGFPLSRSNKYQGAVSNAVNVEVNRLPEEVAAQVNGAIGSFRISATIDSFRMSTDDALTFSLELRGNGDKRNITAPNLNLSDDWEVYPPKLVTEEESARGEEITMYQRYAYLLVPNRAGRLLIDPEISFLDADKDTVVTATLPKPYAVMVRQGKKTVTIDEREIVGAYEMSPAVGEGQPHYYRQTSFAGVGHHAALGISFFLLGGMYMYKRRLEHEQGLDPRIKRQKKAARVATARLSEAQTLLSANKYSAFYEKLSSSLYGYFEDKYGLVVGTLSMQQLLEKLAAEKGVSEGTTQSLRVCLEACQQSLYAGAAGADRQALYERSEAIIIDLETR